MIITEFKKCDFRQCFEQRIISLLTSHITNVIKYMIYALIFCKSQYLYVPRGNILNTVILDGWHEMRKVICNFKDY